MDGFRVRLGRKRFWAAGLFGLFLLYYTVKQADLAKLTKSFHDIDLFWAALMLGAGAASYFFIAAVLHQLLKGIGRPLRFSSVFQISLLSCTLNYLLAFAGLSGVAAKVYMLSRQGIPPSKTLSVSMVHGFLTNTVAVALIYLGFFFMYSHRNLSIKQVELAIPVLAATFLLTWVTIRIIVSSSFRGKLWTWVLGVSKACCSRINRGHWIQEEKADAFFCNFDDSMKLLMSNNRMLLAPAGCALLDWLFMFLCLACAFRAVHCQADPQALLVGFSVAIFAALFSFTPVGIGVMEGTMVGSFYLMGLDYDDALLAILLYRLTYYWLPLFVSLFFYRRLLSPSGRDDERMQDIGPKQQSSR